MPKDNKEQWIARNMAVMKWSREEAEAVWDTDKVIDKGGKTDFDLTQEQAKIAKQYTKTGTRKAPVAYKFDKRERKANPTKGAIIAELAQFLTEKSENALESVEIVNKERQIAFKVGETSFELTLIQKRAPKKA